MINLCKYGTLKKTNNKNCKNGYVFDLLGVTFIDTALSILSKWFPPVGHCAIVKQLVISDEDWATSHIHKNTHADSRKWRERFFFFFFCQRWDVSKVPLCVKTNKVELWNMNSFSSHKVGFHVLRGDSWGELTVQLCIIAVNGFPVLIMELQKDEKTQAPSPT